MAYRVPGTTRTAPIKKRRPVVPVPFVHSVEDQPVYRPPPPPPTPQATPPPPPSVQFAKQEQKQYDEAGWNLLNIHNFRRQELEAREVANRATAEKNRLDEETVQAHQEKELRLLQESFMPETPSLQFVQAASFRGDRPISEIYEEAREAEGQANLIKFGRWRDKASPYEQEAMGGMSAGLIKENMTAGTIRDIVDAERRNDGSVYQYTPEQRKSANRIISGSRPTPTLGEQTMAPGTSFIPEDAQDANAAAKEAAERIRQEAQEEEYKKQPHSYAGGHKPDPKEGEPIFSLKRDIIDAPENIPKFALGVIDTVFEAEQEAIPPLTGPIIKAVFETARIPYAEPLAEEVSRLAVPTTAITGGAKTVGWQLTRAAAAEGLINMMQVRGRRGATNKPMPSIREDAINFFTGAGGRLALHGAGAAVTRARGKGVPDVGAPKVDVPTEAADDQPLKLNFYEADKPKLGRHTVNATDEAGQDIGKIEWREPPAGEPGTAHIVDVHVDEAYQGRGVGSALRKHVMDDMAERGYTDVTSDLSTPAGARLAGRSGASFEDAKGLPLTADEAVEEAALGLKGRGPRSRTRLTPEEAPPVAKAADEVLDEAPTDMQGNPLSRKEIKRRLANATEEGRTGDIEWYKKALNEAPETAPPTPKRGKIPPEEPKAPESTPAAAAGTVEGAPAKSPEEANLAQEAAADLPEAPPVEAPTPKKSGRFQTDDTIYDKKGQPYTFVKHGGKKKPGMVYVKKGNSKKVFAIPRKGLSTTSPTAVPLPIEPHKTRFKAGADPIERLGSLVRTSKRLRGEAQVIKAGIRGEKTAAGIAAEEAAEKAPGRRPGDVSRAAKGQQKGKEILPIIDPPRGKFTDEDILAIEDAIKKHYPDDFYGRQNARNAMDRLLDGYPLAPHEIKSLTGIMPADVLDRVKPIIGLARTVGQEALDIALNAQRMIQVGVGDLGHLLRQAFLATSHPRKWSKNAVDSVRFLFSGKYSDDFARAVRDDVDFDTLYDLGLDLEGVKQQLGEGARTTFEENLLYGEGKIMAWLGNHAPVIKQTTRAFRLGLATLRFSIAKEHLANMRRLGATTEELSGMANFVNRMTGRGTLGPAEKLAPQMNALFYAARLQASHIQAPAYIFFKAFDSTKGSRYVQKLAARTLISSTLLAGGTLALAKAVGADIEVDPRSSNFGKIKIGPTRIDVTGGFAPMIRLVDRIATEAAGGKGLKTDIGDFRNIGVKELIGDFLQGKLSPGASTAYDAWRGENFAGEKLTADWATVRREAINRGTPLFLQSMVEAYQEGGWADVPFASAELVGLGTMTYTPPTAAINNLINDDIEGGIIDLDDYPEFDGEGPRTRGELHPKDQRDFEKRHREELAEIEKQYELQGPDALSSTFKAQEETANQLTADVAKLDKDLNHGTISGKEYRESIEELKSDSRAVSDFIGKMLEDQGFEEGERPEESGYAQDMYDYGAIFDKYPNAKIDADERSAMFNNIEVFYEIIGPEREAELDDNMNLGFKESPTYRIMENDKDTIDESGYHDRVQDVWDQVVGDAEDRGVDLPDDYYDYKRQLTKEASGLSVRESDRVLHRDRWLRRHERIGRRVLRRWSNDNPEALDLVIKWGYKDDPSKWDIGTLEEADLDDY